MSITLDGSSGITFPQGAAQIVGAGPAFSGYASASQTVTLNTATKVAIDTEDFDTNSNYDSTTNYRFTPTVAGYYQVNVALRGSAATTLTVSAALIYKNGVELKRFFSAGSFTAGSIFTAIGNMIIYLNGTTDYIEFYGLVNGSGAASFNVNSTAATSVFSAALVRGA
jgi:hypothetical protein